MEEITNMNEKLAEMESFLDEVYTICTERTFDECSAIYNKLSNVAGSLVLSQIVPLLGHTQTTVTVMKYRHTHTTMTVMKSNISKW